MYEFGLILGSGLEPRSLLCACESPATEPIQDDCSGSDWNNRLELLPDSLAVRLPSEPKLVIG